MNEFLAVGPWNPAQLYRIECLHVEVNGGGSVVDRQVGQHSRLNFDRHSLLLFVNVGPAAGSLISTGRG